MDTFIQFHRPWIDEDEEREVIETLRSGWLTTGERTQRFEVDFACYAEASYAVGVNSCTAALFLSLKSLLIGPGDEVITTPMTFAASANVVIHTGARPVFVDIDPVTMNINPELIERAITKKTRAILPVHFRGVPCDMDAITAVARKYDLYVIEDAAHAIESRYSADRSASGGKDKKIGSISDTTCFSFYPNKNITTGEGGMVTTGREELANKIRMLSNHGLSRTSWQRYSPGGGPLYEVIEPGYKFNMFDIQAALGIHQLKKIETFWERRRDIVRRYNEAFSGLPQVTVPPDVPDGKNAYHIYVLLLNSERITITRDELLEKLTAEGIGTSVHFLSLHLHKYYREYFGYGSGDYPVAADVSRRTFSLPLYPRLSDEEVDRVIETVIRVCSTYAR